MNALESRVKAANEVLATYTPPPADPDQPYDSAPPFPYLQWCFSEPGVYDHICPPFWFMSWVPDEFDQPSFDYYCNCGKNKSVHDPLCHGLTIPKIRMEPTKSDPLFENVWVLCRWIPPARRGVWLEFYKSLDNYPRNGRYVPVTINKRSVTLPAECPPYPETSTLVIDHFKAHDQDKDAIEEDVRKKQMLHEYRIPLRPDGGVDHGAGAPNGSRVANIRDRLKDRMTFPGPKVYQPGLGENPVIRRMERAGEPIIKLSED